MYLTLSSLIIELARWVTAGVLAWLALSVVLSLVAEAWRGGPRWLRRAATTVSPVVVRLSVRAVVRAAFRLGCVLAAAAPVGLATGPALAVEHAPRPPDAPVPPAVLPIPDRPQVGPPYGTSLGITRSAPSAAEVVVEPGDSLWAIAADQLPPSAGNARIAGCWPKWYSANRERIGADPDLIHPGTRLRPPSDGC